jgi:hypothetical protein
MQINQSRLHLRTDNPEIGSLELQANYSSKEMFLENCPRTKIAEGRKICIRHRLGRAGVNSMKLFRPKFTDKTQFGQIWVSNDKLLRL